MPAISAAANPVAAIASASGTGKPASGTENADRSFSTVLAEQSGKPPKAANGGQAAHEPQKTKSQPPAKEGGTDESTTTTQPADNQTAAQAVATVVPDDRLLAETGDSEAEALDMQIQAITELMQTLQPVPGNPPVAESQSIPVAAPALTLAATAVTDTPGTSIEGDSLTKPVAETQSATTFQVQERTTPNAGQATAKLAAATDAATLPIDARSLPSGEQAAVKPEFVLNTAAVALPAHTAAANQANHGSEYRIVTPVGSQQWESAIGNSLVVMTGAGRDRAELVLTPPQLGRIEVSITMKGDEASAVFVSANPVVREALENALPRLREVLADAGITLGQTQVGSESPGQSAADRQTGDNAPRSASADNSVGTDAAGRTAPLRVISRSLVDTYA